LQANYSELEEQAGEKDHPLARQRTPFPACAQRKVIIMACGVPAQAIAKSLRAFPNAIGRRDVFKAVPECSDLCASETGNHDYRSLIPGLDLFCDGQFSS